MVLKSGQPSEDSAAAEWVGQTVDDRYRILEVLGEGGMGAVFAAEHLTLHKEVALKMVRPQHAGNRDLAVRFAREAMVTSRIHHPNVISAIDYGTLDNGIAYLTMELVRGCSLSDLLDQEGCLHWARAADLGAQIADALCAAAEHGIVHRDLKPENVLIERPDDGRERVRVLDFGIAKYMRDSLAPPALRGAQQVTEIGVVIGTPGYMAPEQAIGRRADLRADLYSLGVLLWEMMVGRRLWEGDSTQEIIRSQLRDNPPSPRALTGDHTMPLSLDQLVLQLLANAPQERPGDVVLVREALRAAAASAPLEDQAGGDARAVARVAGWIRRGGDQPATRVHPPAGAVTRAQTPLSGESVAPPAAGKRRPALVGIGLFLAGGALLLAMSELWNGGEQSGAVEPQPPAADRAGEAGAGADEPSAMPPAEPPQKGATPPSAPPSAPSTAPADSAGGLPGALEPVFDALSRAAARSTRAAAARRLLAHEPAGEVPQYARALSHFQLAESCREKRQQFARVQKAAHVRLLPALELTSQRARSGCGPRGRRDCLRCMRGSLQRLIEELQALERMETKQ